MAITAAGLWSLTPGQSTDEALARIAASGPAYVLHCVWNDVKRNVLTVTKLC